MTFVSIIIGLSVAEILSGLTDSLTRKKGRKFSWIYTTISVGIFLILIQVWWESWELKLENQWAFPHLLLFLSIPVLLFIISRILNPGRDYSGSLDDYYFDNASKIWILLGIGLIIGNTFRTILYGSKLFIIDNLNADPMLIICIVLGISTKKVLHKILVPLTVLIILLDVLLINYFITQI
jgi:hypothetical protein